MAVGQSILTLRGVNAIIDAQRSGSTIKPKYYKVSNMDITLDPSMTDINGVWKQDAIYGYITIGTNTIEFIVDIPIEQATNYGRVFGLYFDDGTLFMLAKPPYPFPPYLRQVIKIQMTYTNAVQYTDFQYVPHSYYENTEVDLAQVAAISQIGDAVIQVKNDLMDEKIQRQTTITELNNTLQSKISRLNLKDTLILETLISNANAITSIGDGVVAWKLQH